MARLPTMVMCCALQHVSCCNLQHNPDSYPTLPTAPPYGIHCNLCVPNLNIFGNPYQTLDN